MDFMGDLVGAYGCNTDGTTTNNPFTSFVEKVVDYHVVGDTSAGAADGSVYESVADVNYASYDSGGGTEEQQMNMNQAANFQSMDQFGSAGLAHQQSNRPMMPMMQMSGFHPPMMSMGMGMGMGMMHPPPPPMMMMIMNEQESHYDEAMDLHGSRYDNNNNNNSRVRAGAEDSFTETERQGYGYTHGGDEVLREETYHENSEYLADYDQKLAFQEEIFNNYQPQMAKDATKEGYDKAWKDIQSRLEHQQEREKRQQEYRFASENPFYRSGASLQEAGLETSSGLQGSDLADAATAAATVAAELADQRGNALFDRGMELYNEGKIKEAILAFEASIQERGVGDTSNDETWRMLGSCHAEQDEDKNAILCLKRAIECDPYNLDVLVALGTSYVNELNSVKALETLRTWVKHNPSFQDIQAEVDEYSDGTLMDEVMNLMLKVVEFAPDDVDAQIVLGVLYNVSLDYDSAVECFQKALNAQPYDFSLLNKLAATHANGNGSDSALQYYSRALEIRPTYTRGWLNLGISFANLNQYEEAAKAYVQALHLNPNASHIWSYLRVVFTCMDRLDLVAECASSPNLEFLAQELHLQLIT